MQKISSPKLLNQFSPVGRVIRRNSYVDTVFSMSLAAAVPVKAASGLEEKVGRPPEERKVKKHLTFTTCSLFRASQAPPVVPEAEADLATRKKSTFWQEAESVSPGIEEEAKDLQALKCVVVYCGCGRICKPDANLCEECVSLEAPNEASGYLYVEKDERNMDRYWFNLINTDLYCIPTIVPRLSLGYKDKCETDYIQMINIGGYFVEERGKYRVDDTYTLYEFALCTQWEKRTLYAISEAERKNWVAALRKALGYSDITRAYELGVTRYMGDTGREHWGRARSGRCGRGNTRNRAPWWQSRCWPRRT